MKALVLALTCLAILHTPDGKTISVDTRHIVAVRPLSDAAKGHVAPGTKSILYVTGQAFGITETPDEAQTAIEDCLEGR